MYEEWHKYEKEKVIEFYEKGLSKHVINVWEILEEFPLNEGKTSWRMIKNLKEIMYFPQFALVPINVERFWEQGINPKLLRRFIEEKKVLPVITTVPKSFENQPRWIQEVISTTKKVYGFYPPYTQWRYEAYVTGLVGLNQTFDHYRTYQLNDTYEGKILSELGVDISSIQVNSPEDFECRYTAAICRNLSLMGFKPLIDKIIQSIKNLQELKPLVKVIYLREIIDEPYTLFVSPLRTHLAGLRISLEPTHHIWKRKMNSLYSRIMPRVIKDLIKDIREKISFSSPIQLVLPDLKHKELAYKFIQKLQESPEWDEYRKFLYGIWKEAYELGRVNVQNLKKITEISKAYISICEHEAMRYYSRIRRELKVLRVITYSLTYGPLGLSVLSGDVINVLTSTAISVGTEVISRKISKSLTAKELIAKQIKEKYPKVSIPQVLSVLI